MRNSGVGDSQKLIFSMDLFIHDIFRDINELEHDPIFAWLGILSLSYLNKHLIFGFV